MTLESRREGSAAASWRQGCWFSGHAVRCLMSWDISMDLLLGVQHPVELCHRNVLYKVYRAPVPTSGAVLMHPYVCVGCFRDSHFTGEQSTHTQSTSHVHRRSNVCLDETSCGSDSAVGHLYGESLKIYAITREDGLTCSADAPLHGSYSYSSS